MRTIIVALVTLVTLAPLAAAVIVNPEQEIDATDDYARCLIEADVDFREYCGGPPQTAYLPPPPPLP